MPTVGEIFEFLNSKAPVETRLDFDNVGLLVGSPDWTADTVLLSLDVTGPVIREAAERGAQLVISHHPLFFELKNLGSGDPQGVKAMELLTRRIAAVCMHTNLDAAEGGVNDTLASLLDLQDVTPISPENIGRVGTLKSPMKLSQLAARCNQLLDSHGGHTGNGDQLVSRVAVLGGSGGGDLEYAQAAGADAYLTGEAKHHEILESYERDLPLILCGHYETERVVLKSLRNRLQILSPDVQYTITLREKAPLLFS